MPRLFESAFTHAAIGMALVAPDGRWLRVNRSLCQLVGYSELELLARSFQDITHPDDLDADLTLVGQVLRGEIESYQMEKRYFRKDGCIVWVLLSVSLAREDDGRPRCFISQVQDISARKEAEARAVADAAERQHLFDQLRRASEEIHQLQEGLVTICAWTKQVRVGNEWKSMEEFLTERLHLKLSHGISDDALGHIQDELGRLKNSTNPDPGPPA
jgi:PAS domain S-box-containing protein